MNYQELCEQVKSGLITFDPKGHLVSSYFKDRFIERYEDTLKGADGDKDNKWSLHRNEDASIEEVNLQMREFYRRHLTAPIKENEEIPSYLDCQERCFGCAEQLHWVLEGNILKLKGYWIHNKNDSDTWRERICGTIDRLIYPENYQCPYATPRTFKGKIKVNSNLIFANFFRHVEDGPEDLKYSDNWSLNYLIGRENITKYKAERNVAYGQMGNMSIGIYVHPNKKSIIIGPRWIADRKYGKLSDEERQKVDENEKLYEELENIDDHVCVGDGNCLDVWRWEATEKNSIPDFETFEKEFVEVEVEHGTWEFEQFYRCTTNDEDENYIYAKLTLI